MVSARRLPGGLSWQKRQRSPDPATLPGIVRYVYCIPDGHWGYGFPLGGVAALVPAGRRGQRRPDLKDAERLLLRVQHVGINRESPTFILQGRASGETINPNMHELGADVTGVTLHRLQVVQTANGWEAPVLLDV
jgi:hypothetical protein